MSQAKDRKGLSESRTFPNQDAQQRRGVDATPTNKLEDKGSVR